jgi:hypothetical protein
MLTQNKPGRAQGPKFAGSASTPRDSTTAGAKNMVSKPRPTKVSTNPYVRAADWEMNHTVKTSPSLDEADYEAARILLEMRYALPDSDSTISAPKSGPHSDSTITAPNVSPPSSLHETITVQDFMEWEVSGIEKLSDYLECKDAALTASR